MVKVVAENCVPIALNADRMPDDAAGKFFRSALEHSKWPQGVWVLSPEGKVLAFHYFRAAPDESSDRSRKRWAQETAAAVRAGLEAFGPVEPRQVAGGVPLPDRGLGRQPDGGVRLAVFGTYVSSAGRREDDPLVDSVPLLKSQWQGFVPARAEPGFGWDLPEETARQFAPALCPITDSIYAPQAKDAKVARLHAEVESVQAGRVWLRLTGRWETEHSRDDDAYQPIRAAADGDGFACYDPEKKRLVSFLLVLRGTYRNIPPWDKPRGTAAVIEWRAEAARPTE